MRRLRFLRFLLPVALVAFVVIVVLALRPPPQVHRDAEGVSPDSSRRAGKFRFVELRGAEAVLDCDADLAEEGEDGKVHLENIERCLINRLDRDPLVVSASLGDYEGEPGERLIRFERKVRIRDPIHDLTLALPGLVVDEAAGEARSMDEVVIEGDRVSGRGSSLVYGLKGQPTELTDPVLRSSDGAVLTAGTARMLDGLDDVEFRDRVRVRRGEESFDAATLRVLRGDEGKIRRMAWSGDPATGQISTTGGMTELRAARTEAGWDPSGEISSFRLEGDAVVSRATESIAAASIEGRRDPDAEQTWAILAKGTVYLRGLFGGQPAWLRAESVESQLDEHLELRHALALGMVRFEGPGTQAEADRASFRPDPDGGEIQLQAVERPKARLARDRMRVAARTITTDPRGESLLAEDHVEATLLPGGDQDREALSGMFRVEEAIHFVAARLRTENGGARASFEGGVRGWQGERNLAAERVVLNQADRSMTAIREVATRIPRGSQRPALTENEYVQIGADRLDYSEATKLAVYKGHVRVRLAEGWMEAERMEVELGEEGSGIRSVKAFERVRVEFRDTADREVPRMVSGSADRLTYDPVEQTVRLFGDKAPAKVRQLAEGGGTTAGKVLRYRLDLGTLEVDAGEQGPARIRTSGE